MRKEEEKMSKIKLKIGNIGRGNKKVFAAIAVSALVMVAAITVITSTQAQTPIPHAIYGYVWYVNGDPVENATVVITVINGSNSSDVRGTLINTTDNTGFYSVDFGNLPVEWENGDNVTAYAYIIVGNNTFGGDNFTIADNSTTQQWLNVTINEPSTIKTIGEPKCSNGYYVTNETEFNLTATPVRNTTLNATYYRLWHNGAWTSWMTYSGNFTLDMGEGLYYLEFYSEAYNATLGEYYDEHIHNQSHYVDDIPPATYAEFGEPKVEDGLTIIGPYTPLWINASEYNSTHNGSGVREIHYIIYRNMTAPGNWELVEEQSVYFENTTNASVELYFDSGCYYEVRWYAVDCLGNKGDLHHVQFAVDVKYPSIHLDIGDPNYYDNETNRLWVNCSTPIWVNVTDNGCGGIQAGVKQLIINVSWNETTGNYFEHYYVIVVNDGGANDSDGEANGEIHYLLHFPEECYHEPEFRAIDYVDNTFAFKKEFFVDCEPPWVNKTIPKIAFLEQTEYNTSVEVNDTGEYWQSFPALWSYVDAVDVHICGDFYGYGFKAQIKDLSNTVMGETDWFTPAGHYCGWVQLHFTHRVYLEHGKTYFLYLVPQDPSVTFYWNASNNNPLNLYYAHAGYQNLYGTDFAFKLEYYPVFFNTTTPYPSIPEYSFWNFTTEHNGLNNTWITSKAFFHIASEDEGCMGGVGLDSLQYRIWSNGTWGNWTNYTEPFNISQECKHYVQIKAIDKLGQTRITNQTHYVDNSPPVLIPPWKIFEKEKHGWFNDSDGTNYTYRMRAGYGIWFNFTDMPDCHPVGFREATLYWRYTYTNFTMPNPEVHPANGSDYNWAYNADFAINQEYSIEYIDGTYWYAVHLDNLTNGNSTYINFSKECMHDITYFYKATDWLDNNVTSERYNLTIYVDGSDPTMGDMTVWGHYYYNESNPHPVNETFIINDTAGHIRAGKPFYIDATDRHMLRKVCIAQTEHNSDDTLQKGANITSWPNDAQLFNATCDHINATKLYLFWDSAAKVKVVIHNGSYDGTNPIGESTYDLTGSGSGWVTFTFSPGLPVEKGKCYYLEVFVENDSNAVVRWAYNSSDNYGGTDCYAVISHQNYNYTRDWAFQIITNDPNPCDSGLEGIYYGYYYNGEWYPNAPGPNVINIVEKYGYSETDFYNHQYWYVYNDSTGVIFNEECMHDFYYWAKDNVCHHTEIYHHVFYVDDSAPEVNIEMPSCYSVQGDVVEKVIWHESFEDGNADDWTMGALLGGDTWKVKNASYIGGNGWTQLPIDGNYALIYDDDAWNPAGDRNASYAISPPIDCTAYDIVYLSFAAELEELAGSGILYVRLSNDNGSTWYDVWTADEDEYGFYIFDISTIAARHTILLNFTYDDEADVWAWGAVVDNITVYYPREHISCDETMYLNAMDYPITYGKVVDQQQTDANAYDGIEDNGPLYTAQSFVPSEETLDAVQLLLDSGTGGEINISIYDSGLNLIAYNDTVIPSVEEEWIQFHFNDTVYLTAGETYWISVTSNGGISWMWLNGPDKYPNGMMIRTGGLDPSHDFAFKTEYYGYLEGTCAAGLEGIYYGYYYNGTWYPQAEGSGVINISIYYNETEINDAFGGHTLWYIYDASQGISFEQQCKHELYYWAKDNVCHHTIVYERTLYVDNTEPEIQKTHPDCYEVVNGTEYIQKGADITLYADDMPSNNCSSGTWIYWRYTWDNPDTGEKEYFPFFYNESFESLPFGWTISYPWWGTNTTYHDGIYSIRTNDSSYVGWAWLESDEIGLPDIPKITLTFWQRADNLSYYDAANMFGVEIEGGIFVPLKIFYKDDMSNEWQKVTVDLTPFANQTVKLAWVYENDYGLGETWYIDEVNITGWYGVYGYENVTQSISFNEECHHDLYYFAEDTTCHATEIHHQEYYVDGTAPYTDYETISTNCTYGYAQWNDTGRYWQACDWANISFVVDNTGTEPCIDPNTFTYVRYEKTVWNESSSSYETFKYPDAAHGELINGEYWYNITDTMYLNLTDACNHTVYYFSKDGVCNVEDVHTVEIHIDNAPPITTPSFYNFNCGEVPYRNKIYFINNHTLIGLNATDYPIGCASGVKNTHYRVWKYNYTSRDFDIPLTDGWVQYDDSHKINLTYLVEIYNSIHGTDYTVCGAYEIWYNSSDNCCHDEDTNMMDVIVDCQPPTTDKIFSGSYVVGEIEGIKATWISNNTIIWFNSTDTGNQKSGVKRIYWRIKNDMGIDITGYSDNPNEYDTEYHYSLSVGDLVSTYNLPDGKYDLFHWAVDRVCNEEVTHHKQWVVIDNTPPSSCVERIVPYEQKHPPFNITVTDIEDHGPANVVGVCKVELYYRYSIDNSSWSDWILYAVNDSLITHADGTADDWTLVFNNATRLGYYEFRSIAYDCLGNVEVKGAFNPNCDAMCHVPDIDPPVSVKTYGSPVVELAPDIHAIRSNTKIWINITDMPDAFNASGVDKLMISFDGTNYYTVTSFNVIEPGNSGSYKVSYEFTPADYGFGEGSYQMFFYAVDNEGNIENETKQKFIVDDTAPTTEIIIDGNETMPFTITINASDIVGVKSMTLYYRYSEDGVTWGSWTEYATNDSIVNVNINHTLVPEPWTVQFNMPMTPGYYKPGHYEFYVVAVDNLGNSKGVPTSGTPGEASCYVPPWAEDLNADGRVNIVDMLRVLNHFGETGTPGFIPEDVNKDGTIDVGDLIAIGQKWTG